MSRAFAYFRSDRNPPGITFDDVRKALVVDGFEPSLLDTNRELGHGLVRVELSINEEDRLRQRLGLEHFLRGALPDVDFLGYVVDGKDRIIDWSEPNAISE